MAKIIIDRDRCKGCLLCLNFCPKGLISIDKDLNRLGIKPARFSGKSNLKEEAGCRGCAVCAIICPDCCIEVYK